MEQQSNWRTDPARGNAAGPLTNPGAVRSRAYSGNNAMEWTIRTFVEAREATERVLDELGIGTYLFDVEPRDEGFEVKVECQSAEGWKVTRVPVEREALLRSLHDPGARAALLTAFRARIGDGAAGARQVG